MLLARVGWCQVVMQRCCIARAIGQKVVIWVHLRRRHLNTSGRGPIRGATIASELLLLLLMMMVVVVVVVMMMMMMVAIDLLILSWANYVMYILLMSPQRPRVAIGFITALDCTIKWLPITMRLQVACQMVVPLERLRALVAGKFSLVRVG